MFFFVGITLIPMMVYLLSKTSKVMISVHAAERPRVESHTSLSMQNPVNFDQVPYSHHSQSQLTMRKKHARFLFWQPTSSKSLCLTDNAATQCLVDFKVTVALNYIPLCKHAGLQVKTGKLRMHQENCVCTIRIGMRWAF
jgi:hypothetical protein